MSKLRYRAGLDTALHGAGLPYGYTVTIWGSGQLLIHAHGTPGVGLILLFVTGAAAAYGLMKVASDGASAEPQLQLSGSAHLLRAGAIHLAAIGSALGAAALVAVISSEVAWALGGFAATAVYLGVSAVEMAIFEREEVDDAG